ncbi:MAG: c-type cytochrome, partial [Longimicrobiales bacterium]
MASRGRTILGTTLTILAIGVMAFLLFVYSGWYDVSASTPHYGGVRWTLDAMTERSVAVRADEVTPPAQYGEDLVAHGFDHYVAMCETCHGGVGVEAGEIGQGLNPQPPDLEDAAEEYTDAELFWILKHGIKFTGMPAFGPTHSDQELWGIV